MKFRASGFITGIFLYQYLSNSFIDLISNSVLRELIYLEMDNQMIIKQQVVNPSDFLSAVDTRIS